MAIADVIPPCAAMMGCLCAGHASGLSADEACDTSEERARARTAAEEDIGLTDERLEALSDVVNLIWPPKRKRVAGDWAHETMRKIEKRLAFLKPAGR